MRSVLALLLVATAWMAGDHPMSAQATQGDPCPLKWRRDPAAAAEAREVKKQRMRRNGVPERYLHLLDKMECVACIETAPDTLHITVLYNDDEHAPTLSDGRRDLKVEFKWNPQSERQLREELRNGQIQAFYVWIHEKRCNCCPDWDTKAEDQVDWDDDLGANKDETQEFDDPSDLGPLPDDLKPPPPGAQTPPPPIESFDHLKPRQRYMHVICDACQGLADQWNKESSNLSFLWDRKLEQMRRVSVINNAIGNRRNEIAHLEYQQRFDSTRTYDRMQQINELKRINEGQEVDADTAERKVEEYDRLIAETEMRMEAIRLKVLECEKACQTTTATAVAAGDTTFTLGPSVSYGDPRIPDIPLDAPPSTSPTPGVRINTSVNVVTPPRLDASTPLLPYTPPPASTVGTDPEPCPQCAAVADAANTARQQLADTRATLDNIRSQITQLQQALKGAAAGSTRAADIQGQLMRLGRAEVANIGLEQARAAALAGYETALAACRQQCAAAASGGRPTNTTGGPPGTEKPLAHEDEKPISLDPANAVAKCEKCQPIVTALLDALRRARDFNQRAGDWVTHWDIVVNEISRNAREQRLMEQRYAATKDEAFNTRARQLAKQSMDATEALMKEKEALDLERRQLVYEINDLWARLDACNTECATATATANGNLTTTGTPTAVGSAPTTTGSTGGAPTTATSGGAPTSTGTTGGVPGVNTTGTPAAAAPDAPPASCPDCNAIVAAIAGLQKQIADANTKIGEVQAAASRNNANIANIARMRFEARENPARVAELEGRISDLEAANATNAKEQFDLRQQIAGYEAEIGRLLRRLEACNKECLQTGTVNPETGGTGVTGTGNVTPKRTVAVDPLNATAACQACEETAQRLRTAHDRLVDLARRANDLQFDEDITAAEEQRARVAALVKELAECNATKCPRTTTANADPPPVSTGNPGGLVDLHDPELWGTAANADVDQRIQIKMGDVVLEVVIRPVPAPRVEQWFNPLGLLARRLVDNLDRWRGSLGPRPLITPRDLAIVDEASNAQGAGLPKGLHVLLTDRGGSTGKTLGMQVLNLTGQPVRLAGMPFAIEPIRQQVQARVNQAFTRLAKAAPINVDLAAYCIEFLKQPPGPNTLFRLAPAAVQQKYASMSKVLQAASRLQQSGLLRPDSDPAAYADAVKQWALWTVEQNFNEARFTDAFLAHTKKNVEAAGQPWPRTAEATIRKVSPNRWRDISQILSGAGLPVPR